MVIRNCFSSDEVKTYGGMEVKLHISLTSALDGNEYLASCSYRFIAGGRDAGTHWIGDWVGPRNCLYMLAQRKSPCP